MKLPVDVLKVEAIAVTRFTCSHGDLLLSRPGIYVGVLGSNRFRITVALDGHADVNSTDDCTVAGTSARVKRSNPNLGK